MLTFCPSCGNVLAVQDGDACLQFTCRSCPYTHNVTRGIARRKYTKLKEVEDVLSSAAAWENLPTTSEACPKCHHPTAYYMQMQTRSADEPMTVFYRCEKCDNRWKE